MKHFTLFAVVLVFFGLVMDSNAVICPCPRHLVPVCGTDGRTYSNRCLLNCQAQTPQGRSLGLRVYKQGKCAGDQL